MRYLSGLISALIILFLNAEAYAQCCSPGNPVAGTAAAGIVMKHNLRVVTFYRHSFSDTYYTGTKPSPDEDQIGTANFNFAGAIFAYGITKRLTVETELGYFINKTKNDTILKSKQSTSGMYNGTLSMKYCLIHSSNGLELSLGAGAKFPFTQQPISNELGPLPEDIQPSTGAFGFVGQLFIAKAFPSLQFKLIWTNRYEINGRNLDKYKFGNAWYSSLFFSKGLGKGWVGLLQFRNENRKVDFNGETKFPSTGGNVFIISPQLSHSFGHYNVTAMFDMPVMRNLNGKQLNTKYAYSISINRDFSL
ncbi:MAG: transporter [Bacteroidota bacterium]